MIFKDKEIKVYESRIKEVYDSSCEDVQHVLEVLFPEVFEEEKEFKFKRGDIVRVVSCVDADRLNGAVGMVLYLEPTKAGIDFGNSFDGHRCHGKLERSTGWWVLYEDLELVTIK